MFEQLTLVHASSLGTITMLRIIVPSDVYKRDCHVVLLRNYCWFCVMLLSDFSHTKSYLHSIIVQFYDAILTLAFTGFTAALKASDAQLFPTTFSQATDDVPRFRKIKQPNGGWGDARDHKLCRDIVHA